MKHPEVNHQFSDRLVKNAMPSVVRVCSKTIGKHVVTNRMAVPNVWALEYHQQDSGVVRLGDEKPYRNVPREAKYMHIYAPGAHLLEKTTQAQTPIRETYITIKFPDYCPWQGLIDEQYRFTRVFIPVGTIGPLFLSIFEHVNSSGNFAFWKVQAVLMEIIHVLQKVRKSKLGHYLLPPADALDIPTFAERVDTFLSEHLQRKLTIPQLASHLGVSESGLFQKYKTETGVTPMVRLSEMRVDFAKDLLLKGERLKVIAESIGFCDEYHLSKVFKKMTGMTPRQYINENRQSYRKR